MLLRYMLHNYVLNMTFISHQFQSRSMIINSKCFQVLHISKDLLLQTAAPEAIARLKHTPLADEREKIIKIYFEEQHHNSIEDFLIYNVCQKDSPSGLLMQV